MGFTANESNQDKKSWGSGGLFGNRALGSLFLLVFTPIFVLTFWHCCKNHAGSFQSLISDALGKGVVTFITDVYPTPFDPYSWQLIFSYMVSYFETFIEFSATKYHISNIISLRHLS